MTYKVPTAAIIDEQIIKKSRFITHITRAINRAEAVTFIAQTKAKYPDARHHCWAYIAGHPTATTDIAFSDDGEPQGTAGKPILNVLQHRGIGEIVLVVVRYFGGIKLGAGGLVRAYSSSASLAMDKLETKILVTSKDYKITFAYPLENNIKHLLETHHIHTFKADYTDAVSLHITVPEQLTETLDAQLISSSAGKVSLNQSAKLMG